MESHVHDSSSSPNSSQVSSSTPEKTESLQPGSILIRKRELTGISTSFSSLLGRKVSPHKPLYKHLNGSVKAMVALYESSDQSSKRVTTPPAHGKKQTRREQVNTLGDSDVSLGQQTPFSAVAAHVGDYSLTFLRYQQYFACDPLARCLDDKETATKDATSGMLILDAEISAEKVDDERSLRDCASVTREQPHLQRSPVRGDAIEKEDSTSCVSRTEQEAVSRVIDALDKFPNDLDVSSDIRKQRQNTALKSTKGPKTPTTNTRKRAETRAYWNNVRSYLQISDEELNEYAEAKKKGRILKNEDELMPQSPYQPPTGMAGLIANKTRRSSSASHRSDDSSATSRARSGPSTPGSPLSATTPSWRIPSGEEKISQFGSFLNQHATAVRAAPDVPLKSTRRDLGWTSSSVAGGFIDEDAAETEAELPVLPPASPIKESMPIARELSSDYSLANLAVLQTLEEICPIEAPNNDSSALSSPDSASAYSVESLQATDMVHRSLMPEPLRPRRPSAAAEQGKRVATEDSTSERPSERDTSNQSRRRVVSGSGLRGGAPTFEETVPPGCEAPSTPSPQSPTREGHKGHEIWIGLDRPPPRTSLERRGTVSQAESQGAPVAKDIDTRQSFTERQLPCSYVDFIEGGWI